MDESTITITRQQNQASQKIETTFPTELVDLPSCGHFYANNDPLNNGSVEIKMMTAKEEDILTNEGLIRKGIVLDKLLESLIINKDVKIDNLLVGDKNALFVAARRLAYGDAYGPINLKCKSCQEESAKTINLSELKNKSFDFSAYPKGVNSFEFILPFSKRKITAKLLTNKDEADIETELRSLNKISKVSSEITTRLKYVITSVDGNSDRQNIRSFIDTQLLSRDSIELRKFIRTISPDLDMTFDFVCDHCQATERVGVPMTVQFFWPDAGV